MGDLICLLATVRTLRTLHKLTSNGVWQLRVDLEDFFGNTSYAEYSNFVIDNGPSYYKLTIGEYSGDAGDSLTHHADMAFTAYDLDHDTWDNNCAESSKGAWWYRNCLVSNLNGLYSVNDNTGMVWKSWKENDEVIMLKKSEMKIRRIW